MKINAENWEVATDEEQEEQEEIFNIIEKVQYVTRYNNGRCLLVALLKLDEIFKEECKSFKKGGENV
jgi:hypothetical protein